MKKANPKMPKALETELSVSVLTQVMMDHHPDLLEKGIFFIFDISTHKLSNVNLKISIIITDF